MRNTLLFLFCGLFLAPALAQHKHNVSLGLRLLPLPCDYIIAGGSLSYYHTNGSRTAWGLKANYNTDALSIETDFYSRIHAINLDLVQQIRLAGGKKSSWWLDLGVSGLAVLDVTPPQDYFLECAVGLTAADMAQFSAERARYERGFTEARYYAGLALATTFERRLGKHWGIGAELMLNLYYAPEASTPVAPYPNPALLLLRRF